MKSYDPIRRAAISIQYGAVEINGNSYICPVRSIAISSVVVRSSREEYRVIRRVNDATFTNYHRFGSTMRILEGASAQ